MKLKNTDKKKKKKKKNASKAAPYLRRTLEDERVHRHLSDAAAALSQAYRRAARQPGAKAVEDKKLYDQVRGALGSIRAALGIVSEPEPEPPKRRKRKALTVAVLVGTAGFAAKKVVAARRGDGARDYSGERPGEPVEPAPRAPQAA
jgi:uncharacterized membrane protein YccC